MANFGDAIKVNEAPDQFRRKAQNLSGVLADLYDQTQDLDAYVKGLPAYGGVWREQQATPLTVAITTSWEPISGFTTERPSVSKKIEVDYTTGLVRILESGVYDISVVIVYEGNIGRYVDFGARVGGVDPLAPSVRQEILTNNGDMLVSYTTMLSITDVPVDYYLVWKGEIAMNIDFDLGGWAIGRRDYNSSLMANQRIF